MNHNKSSQIQSRKICKTFSQRQLRTLYSNSRRKTYLWGAQLLWLRLDASQLLKYNYEPLFCFIYNLSSITIISFFKYIFIRLGHGQRQLANSRNKIYFYMFTIILFSIFKFFGLLAAIYKIYLKNKLYAKRCCECRNVFVLATASFQSTLDKVSRK